MKSALFKDTLREIKGSFGRFFSILMIVAIGVAFFAGVKASVPDMKYTADQYFDDYNMMDMRVVSTMGLDEKDVEAIRTIEGVKGIFPTYTKDVLTHVGTNQFVLKVHAVPNNVSDENEDYINRPKVIEGRLPEKSGECVIEIGDAIHNMGVKIGDTLTLSSGNETAIGDDLTTDEFTVVGLVQTPYYLSFEKGTSSIGGGTINYFMMIPQDDFKMDYYTEINLTVDNAITENAYSDAYFDITDKVKLAAEGIASTQEASRYADIMVEVQEKLDEGRTSYEDGKATFNSEIASAEAKLLDAKRQLQDGQKQLVDEKAAFEQTMNDADKQLAQGQTQLQDGYAKYNQGKREFEQNQPILQAKLTQLDEQRKQVQEGITQTSAGIVQINEQLANPSLPPQQIAILQAKKTELEATLTSLQNNESQLTSGMQEIETGLREGALQLEQSIALLDEQSATLAQKQKELIDGKAQAQTGFQEAEKKLSDAQIEYEKGVSDLESARKSGEEELTKAEAELTKAQEDSQEIAKPKWYVLDRTSHYSYMDYGSVADRMDGIAKVFPLFFFLVAALVCLTTMTRMVDEQRSDIGTLKALGYGKNAISFKYISYAAIASVFGAILGCSIGMWIFPTIIFNAWNLMYTMPPIEYVAQPALAIGASISVIGVTILAAYLAVYKELVETPSLLMRPKAPKAGKKILLERMTFLWKHFSFTEKVTARNLFRYKKRFFMTVIGISGCTTLLLAGFGIQDSIAQIVTKQYGSIIKYDASISYKADSSEQSKRDAFAQLNSHESFTSLMNITQESGSIEVNEKEEAVSLVIPSDVVAFKEFVSLHERSSQDELFLGDNGVFISEKLSMNMNVDIGDTILVKDKDDVERTMVIQGIVENYVGHFIYMSPVYYQETFHIQPELTTIIAKIQEMDKNAENSLGTTIMGQDNFNSISFYSGAADNFQEMISSLDFIIIVLVIAAGMLAFVVLYNLTNVNISERLREIATIKVLGFYDLEVAEYVYRENVLLTLIGDACGLLLGIGLHRMIMNLAEMENIMFGRNVDTSSYIYATVITLLFALIVNLVMYRKLKKIPMVESLKSIE